MDTRIIRRVGDTMMAGLVTEVVWIAPLLDALAAGFTYKALLEGPVEAPPVTGRPSEV